MASLDKRDFDDILCEIAKRCRENDQVNDLGKALKRPTYEIQSAQVGNDKGQKYDGTLKMLRDWKKTQRKAEAKRTLINAMEKIAWFDMLDECIPNWAVGHKTEPKGVVPTPSTRLPRDEIDSRRQHGEEVLGGPSASPSDSRRQHGEEVLGSPSASPSGLQIGKVKQANPSSHDLDPEMNYVMWESAVKGNALIIGNSDFPRKRGLNPAPRPWAEMDIANMKTLLQSLGYDFRNDENIKRNLSKQEMNEAVKQFTEQLKDDNPQSAVVYISSHGDETGVEGKDRNILPIPDLLQHFSGVLLGKPKILIIDACWGSEETSRLPVAVRNDSTAAQSTIFYPENADIFMIHSTSYGKVAWSFTKYGSFFVKHMCHVVYDRDNTGRDLEDLDTIMLRVTKGIHSMTDDGPTQSTTVLKQGVTRKLFFFPGYSTHGH